MLNGISKKISFENDKLKSGGTAKVIRGKIKDPNMIIKHGIVDVAIKVVNSSEATKRTVSESFRYEIALMAALPDSPNLIKLIGYCLDPMIIIMKYYGMNMEECLQSKHFFSSSRIKLKAMMDVAKGMDLVHSKDIIHFDLKPGNVWHCYYLGLKYLTL